MYIPIEIIILVVIVFGLIIHNAYKKFVVAEKERERKDKERHKQQTRKEMTKEFMSAFYDVSDADWPTETHYEERESEGLNTDIDRWMHKEDVLEKAKTNAEMAESILDAIEYVRESHLDYFVIPPNLKEAILSEMDELYECAKEIKVGHEFFAKLVSSNWI